VLRAWPKRAQRSPVTLAKRFCCQPHWLCGVLGHGDRLQLACSWHRPKLTQRNLAWFALTGILNGTAVLLMYTALGMAPSHWCTSRCNLPLVTALVSALVLPQEALTLRTVAGAMVTVAGVVYLVASVRVLTGAGRSS